jgi:hypothetical protein
MEDGKKGKKRRRRRRGEVLDGERLLDRGGTIENEKEGGDRGRRRRFRALPSGVKRGSWRLSK